MAPEIVAALAPAVGVLLALLAVRMLPAPRAALAAPVPAPELLPALDAAPPAPLHPAPMPVQDEAAARRADQMAPRNVRWLFDKGLPVQVGALTLLTGGEGMGKSTIAHWLAAQVTLQGGNVLVCEAEDGAEDGVLPRLMAAGAERGRVAICGRIDLSAGVQALETIARRVFPDGVRAVVLSPLRLFVAGAEPQGNIGVRAGLERLTSWAEARGLALIGVGHPDKMGRSSMSGSKAYEEVARVLLLATYDARDKNPVVEQRRRVLIVKKANQAEGGKVFPYRLEGVTVGDGIRTSRVVWG